MVDALCHSTGEEGVLSGRKACSGADKLSGEASAWALTRLGFTGSENSRGDMKVEHDLTGQ